MLITLFYGTGMRLSELINLKEKQLDPARSQVKVLGKGNKERIIPVSKEAVKDIEEYKRLKKKEFAAGNVPGEKNGRFFPGDRERQKAISQICLPAGEKITWTGRYTG